MELMSNESPTRCSQLHCVSGRCEMRDAPVPVVTAHVLLPRSTTETAHKCCVLVADIDTAMLDGVRVISKVGSAPGTAPGPPETTMPRPCRNGGMALPGQALVVSAGAVSGAQGCTTVVEASAAATGSPGRDDAL